MSAKNTGERRFTPDQLEQLIGRLRATAQAYPSDIFTPLTEQDVSANSLVVTRASAQMGRHFSPMLDDAAAAIEQLCGVRRADPRDPVAQWFDRAREAGVLAEYWRETAAHRGRSLQALHGALRELAIGSPAPERRGCLACNSSWVNGTPEEHKTGCLAVVVP